MQLNTFFDFCSGIGGGRLGLEQCGMKCVGSSDTSRLSNTTYSMMHQCVDEKNHGDLKKVKCDELPHFDLLIAGFPCQTFSVIGRKAGFSDDRGQIIFHLAKIITETQPKAFILENVRGLVTHDKGETLKIILNTLRNCGYIVSYRVLSSIEFGVPQMRQRIYIIGIRQDLPVDLKTFVWPTEKLRPHLRDYLIDTDNDITDENYDRFSHYLKNPTNNGFYVPEDFICEPYLIIDTRMSDLRLYRGRVPTLRSHRDGIFYVKDGKLKQLTGYEALLLQGFPKELADKVKDNVSNRHLLMQAGNSMTVNVIRELGTSLLNMKNMKWRSEMSNWSTFEETGFNYLVSKYPDTKFTKLGEHDSSIPDIAVETKTGKKFNIETKMHHAQCGQFVLLPNTEKRTFVYSKDNKYPINIHSEKMLAFINANYDIFIKAGTAGANIALEEDLFVDWIKDYYGSKSVKYFLSGKKGKFIISPIEKFQDYFTVTAAFRAKKSGSSSPSKKNAEEVCALLDKSNIAYTIVPDTKKMFVSSKEIFDDMRLVGEKYTYKFAEKDDKFEVRQLSNTCNSNVIFSIELEAEQNPKDLATFEKDI